MDLIINPIIEKVLRPLCASVNWLQNDDDDKPDQFIVWAEEDNRPMLSGNNKACVMGSWVQITLYTRRGLMGGIDPTEKQKEIVAALRGGGFKITENPLTSLDSGGFYQTTIHAVYTA